MTNSLYSKILIMSKAHACIIHTAISTIIFLMFLSVVLLKWYPFPYFDIGGGWALIKILMGLNLALGPLLTIIVFKPGKPGLKLDIICIIIMQLGTLLYGGTIIYLQRPMFIVFAIDRFTTISASEVTISKIQYPELKDSSSKYPLFVQAHFPKDAQLRQDLMFKVLAGEEKDIEFHSELYEPYRPDLQQLRSRSINIEKIISLSSEAKKATRRFINKSSGSLHDYLFLPLKGRNKDIVLVLSSKDGLPIGYINTSPWIEDYLNFP